MNWFTILLIIGIFAYLLVPKMRQAPASSAVEAIRDGAPMIDVRTAREYTQQAIPGSLNYPVGQLEEKMSNSNFSKDEPIIVYCLSGTRSAAAERQLKAMGYTNVMNIGSFSRARKIYNQSQQKTQKD